MSPFTGQPDFNYKDEERTTAPEVYLRCWGIRRYELTHITLKLSSIDGHTFVDRYWRHYYETNFYWWIRRIFLAVMFIVLLFVFVVWMALVMHKFDEMCSLK